MKKMNRVLAGIVAMTITAGVGTSFPVSAGKENYLSSRAVASQGMVLLKNNGQALPLAKGTKLAVFGMNQVDYIDNGGGAAAVNSEYKVSLLQGLQAKAEQGKIELYQPLVDAYLEADKKDTNPKGRKNQISLTDSMMKGAKEFADTAIISIGRFTEEGSDMSESPGGYYLSAAEQAMVDKVCKAGFDRVIVVLNTATAMDTTWFKDNDQIDAALMAWLGGMEGGNAMADILCGDVNPSGKLPDTLVKSYEDYPSSDFNDSSAYSNYTEDIYVGYRYFETLAPDKVNYEFGYGLSYTTFALSDQKVDQDGDNIKATVTVKNTGDRSGKEVVQLYYSAPQGKLGNPAKELAGFAKTKELAPGESQKLTITFAIKDMAAYDDTGKTGHKSAYVLEAGDYSFYLGTSVRNCEKSDYQYRVDSLQVVEQLAEKLTPNRLEKRLLADGTYEELEMNLPNPTAEIKAEGVTKVQCEDFTDAEANIAIETPESGACVGYFNYGRYVSYDLMVEEAGTYYLTLRAANGHDRLTNFLNVYLDGKKQDVSLDMEQTGFDGNTNRWFVFKDCQSIALILPQGKVQLKLECNVGEGPNLDYMLFQKDEPAKTALILGDGSRLKVAETYDKKSDEVKGEPCGDEDGGMSLGYCEPGEWLTYTVQVAESGTYNLTARIASEKSTGSFQVLMDDQVIADFPAQPATGGWQVWKTTDPKKVELTQGEHQLKILFTGSVLNLNWLGFEKADGQQGGEDPSNPGGSEDGELIMMEDVYNDPGLMDAFLDQMTLEELANLSQGQVGGDTGGIGNLPRLGVVTAGTADGPLGLHLNNISYPATAWPCATLMASTFDVDLIQEMAEKIGEEALEAKIDILLGPSMNIHRNPLCGRNFEYYSEDPVVSGAMASAFVNGLQSKGIGATVKHFALNNKETNRRTCDSRVSERAAREIYLSGFKMVIENADPWAIMSSYNPINGVKGSENEELLTGILREEWGYEGLVMSDWDTGAGHVSEAIAGTDVKMPNGQPTALIEAVNDPDSPLTREVLERNAERIINFVMKSRSFYRRMNPETYPIGDNTRLKVAEIYYDKTEEVRAEACQDEDGGMALGYCEPGEWLTYYVRVEESGTYDLTARIASEKSTGSFQVLMDDQVIADFPAQPATGGWQVWKTTDAKKVELIKGDHLMKILFTGSVLNLNWLNFHREGAPVEPEEPVPATVTVTLDKTSIQVGDTAKASVKITPDDADQAVTWSSSDAKVASVDKDGMITGVAAGKAVITATAFNGVTGTAEITVTAKDTPTDPEKPTDPWDPSDPSDPTTPGDQPPSESQGPSDNGSAQNPSGGNSTHNPTTGIHAPAWAVAGLALAVATAALLLISRKRRQVR